MSHSPSAHRHGADRDFYEGLTDRELHPHVRRGLTYRAVQVDRAVGPGVTRLLEVGPGEGLLTRRLAGRGIRVIAVDLAQGWLKPLPSDLVAGRAAAAMTRLPFTRGCFDAVVAAEVIEHIPGIETALAEAARVLRPGGRLIVTVPYRETLQMRTCEECGESYEINGHVHTFDEAKLDALLRGAGLTPQHRFIGPTRFSREILRRAPIEPLLPLLSGLDRLGYRSQRVSDTWMLAIAVRP